MLPKLRKLQLVGEYALKLFVESPKSMNQMDVKSVKRCKKKKTLLQHVGNFPYRRPIHMAQVGLHPKGVIEYILATKMQINSLKHTKQSLFYYP
jgi:hypothetical protein